MSTREFDPHIPRDLHPELESFRKELEIRFERERALLRDEQKRALKRVEELSVNSLLKAREEWAGYEEVLSSERGSFMAELRKGINTLLSSAMEMQDLDALASEVIVKILPEIPPNEGRGSSS